MTAVIEKTKEASELIVVAEQSGLEKSKVESLLSNFGENFKAAQHIAKEAKSINVTDENQTELMIEARQARIELKNIRVEVEHTRKGLKEQSLREGKAIDGMANIIKALVIPVEEHLEKQEKFVENLAKERQRLLEAERLAILLEYVDNPEMYNYSTMSAESFTGLVSELKEAKAKREKAEKEAELDRVAKEKAEREEQERIRKENEALKAEREKREAEIENERAKAVEEARVAKELAEKKEAELRAEKEKADAEAEARLKAEREKREAIEAEQKAKAELEAKQKAEAEEAKRQSLLAPDKNKLLDFASQIDAIELPNVQNREAGKLLDETQDFLNRISKNLRNKAKEL